MNLINRFSDWVKRSFKVDKVVSFNVGFLCQGKDAESTWNKLHENLSTRTNYVFDQLTTDAVLLEELHSIVVVVCDEESFNNDDLHLGLFIHRASAQGIPVAVIFTTEPSWMTARELMEIDPRMEIIRPAEFPENPIEWINVVMFQKWREVYKRRARSA